VELSQKYGFDFIPSNAEPAIEALATNKEGLIKDIETIRLVFPDFRFLNRRKPADAYGDLVDRLNDFGGLSRLVEAKSEPAIQEALKTIQDELKVPLYKNLISIRGSVDNISRSKLVYDALGIPFDPQDPDLRNIILDEIEKIQFSGLSEWDALPYIIQSVKAANPKDVEVPREHLLGLIKRLEGLQARVPKKPEYDPWLTDLNPLVANALKKNLISLDSISDAEIIYSFVDEYGMHNTPLLFELHVELSRAKSLGDISRVMQAEIVRTLHLDLSKIPPADLYRKITTELQKFLQKTQSDLLADRITPELQTPLGIELFNTFKNTPATWAKPGEENEIIERWKMALQKDPELGKLPEGYGEITMKILEVKETELVDEDLSAKKEKDILSQPELNRILGQFITAFREAKAIDNLSQWWSSQLAKITAEIDQQIIAIEAKVATAKNPKAEGSMRNQMKKLEADKDSVLSIVAPELSLDQSERDKQLIEFTEVVGEALSDKLDFKEDLIRTLSAFHQLTVISIAGQGRVDLLNKAIEESRVGQLTSTAVKAWEKHFTEYLKEHYFNANQKNHEVANHAEIPPKLLKTLQSVWGTKI
jgi:hypothetical protein